MAELDSYKLLSVALAIGLLIGLERGWSARNKSDGMRVAGLRTYGLISLLGGLWGLLSQQAGPLLMGFAFLGLTMILLAAYWGSMEQFKDVSITGIVASLITFSLGALTVFGHISVASAAAVVMMALLGFKPLLHDWINHLEEQELYATLKLLLLSVVMLPILPDQEYGPWQAFNPYHTGWMVVLIAGISYLGYFTMKIAGDRHGPVLTGICGGLVSSTAVTLSLSRLIHLYPLTINALSAGVLIACAMTFARTLLLISIISPPLFKILLPTLMLMAMLTFLSAGLLWRRTEQTSASHPMELSNPFQLGMALKFAGLLVLIMLLAKVLKLYFGDAGTYALAAISGFVDVDPITLSMAKMSKGGLAINVAGQAILLSLFVNNVFKTVLSLTVGNKALALRIGGVLLAATLLGLVVLWQDFF